MGLFNLVPNWQRVVVDNPLDAKMQQWMRVGVDAARAAVHVRTGRLKASIGGTYRQSDKTILLHADTPYALVEEFRTPGDHSYLAKGVNAISRVFGGPNIELHYPNAAPAGRGTTAAMHAAREKAWRKNLRFGTGRKTKVIVRRHHRRYDDGTDDAAGLIL